MTPLAEITDYDGFVNALVDRADVLKISMSSAEVEQVAGLPERYIPKLLGPARVKRIGLLSMGPLLAVLGCKLVLVEDEKALARVTARITHRKNMSYRTMVRRIAVTREKLSEYGRLSGIKRAAVRADMEAQRNRWKIERAQRRHRARLKAEAGPICV